MKNEVYNMDCIEYMRSLPDNAFDIAVCDPPYGKGNDDSLVAGGGERFGQRFKRYYRPLEQVQRREDDATLLYPPPTKRLEQTQRWSEGTLLLTDSREEPGRRDTKCKPGGGISEAPTWDVAPPQEFFDELFRVSKNQIIWGGNYFMLPPTRCFLVWKKHIPETFSMAMCEYAWTSFAGNAKVFECPSLRGKHSGKFHPTEKPLALYGWIYRNYVKEGQTVFDPMMGSQASRIAAYMMGIDYVGCEIDNYYFEKGCEWFNRECHGVIKTRGGREIIEQTLF